MRRHLKVLAGLASIGLGALAAGAEEHPATAYADKPFAAVSQADYETFMACYGKFEASLDAVAIFGPNTNKAEAYRNIEQNGRGMSAEFLAPTANLLKDKRYGLDLDAGQAAWVAGGVPFTSAATGQDKFDAFVADGEFSQPCMDMVDQLITATGLNVSIWENAGKPSPYAQAAPDGE